MHKARWELYTRTEDAWKAMLEACEQAEKRIDLEQFVMYADEIGMRFIDVCRRKAREGVVVRILCDAAGSFGLFTSGIPNELSKEGVQIVFFNTLMPWAEHNYTSWFFRDHRKLLVIDSKIAFTGGICIGEAMRDWRDTHVRIEGDIIKEMEREFNSMWERAFKRRERIENRITESTQGFHYVTSSPRRRKRFLYYRLIDAIRNAKHFVYLTTPYFVPDRRLVRVLKLAARRGVDVRLLVPHTSDHPMVNSATRTYFHHCLESGIKIYLYKDTMIHAKTGIIDDEWSTVGSLNLDNISLRYNFEANIVTTDREFALELKKHFFDDIAKSELLTLEAWIRRPAFDRIVELLAWPFRKML
jgi:cardiolipin synthase A/B